MRALKAFALAVAIAIALFAGTFMLGPFGDPPNAVDLPDPPKVSLQRAAPAPVIIVGPTTDVQPSSPTPLLIEVGPPRWVPRDSALAIQGLPSGVALSRGRRLSEDLWAVPVGDLANLRIEAAATAWGVTDLTLTLVARDGSVLAKASTRISINAPTLAAADPSARSSPFKQRNEDSHLRPPPVEVPQTPRETPTESPEAKPSVAPSAADRVGEVEGLSGAAPAHVRMATFEVTAIGAPAKQEPSRSGPISAAAEGPPPAIAHERIAAIALSAAALVAPAHAQRCMIAGGWGTGVFKIFAGFMAEGAMKNSAKARLGDDVKIGAVKKRCAQKGLLIECTARARACR